MNLSEWKNEDDTYNGVNMLAVLSGLPKDEIQWIFNRLKHLMHIEGLSKESAKAQVAQEASDKPWLHRGTND